MADPAVDRPLPHNLEAERAVLGAILLDAEAIHQAVEFIKDTDFFRDAHRRIFAKMLDLAERGQAIDFITIKDELGRTGDLDQVGGPAYIASLVDGLPRGVNVARLRAHRQGEVVAPQPDPVGQPGPRQRLPGRGGRRSDHRRGGARDLRDRRGRDPPGLRLDARPRERELRGRRAGPLAQAARHRRADRLPRAGRDAGRPPAVGPHHRRGPAVDGEDEPRAQHRAARRHEDEHDGRLLQPRDVEGAAVPAHAHVRGRHRRAPAAHRVPGRARLPEADPRDGGARRGADLHRRLGVDRRAGDARQGPAPQGRARPRPHHHRLHPADAGPRPLREPRHRARVDLARPEGARQGAERARRRAVAAEPRARAAARTSGRSSPTCASRAPSSRTPTSSS